MPLSPSFGTAGLFARDPVLWKTALHALYRENIICTQSFPANVLTIGLPTSSPSNLNATYLNFLHNLAAHLSANSSTFDLTSSWASAHASGPSFDVYINNTYDMITAKDQARLVRDPFDADYAPTYEGRLPFVNSSPLDRWAVDDATMQEEYDLAMQNKEEFTTWLNSEILPADAASCSKFLMICIPRDLTPKYRNTYLSGVTPPSVFGTSMISPVSGVLDFVVPIG